MRTRFCLGLGALFLVDCRDILHIAGDTTIADGSVPPDGSTFDGPITNACGTITQVLTTGEPIALAADANGVFWSERIDAESGTVNGWVGNKLVAIASQGPTPIDVRVDDNYVYWNSWNQFPQPTSAPVLNAWPRNVSLPKTTSVPLGPLNAGRLSSDGNNLYFGTWQQQDGGIYALSLPLDGGAPRPILTPVDSPYHVLFEANRIYYDEGADKSGEGTTFSVLDLDGGAVTVIHANTEVDDITAIEDVGFWAKSVAGEVERTDSTLYNLPNPIAIAIDPGSTYLFVVSNADLVRVHVDDTTQTTCFSAEDMGPLVSIVGRTYFTAKVSGAWAIYALDLP